MELKGKKDGMQKTANEHFGFRLLQNRLSFLTAAFIALFLFPGTAPAEEWQSEYAYGPFEIYLNVDINLVRKTLEQIADLDRELSARFSLPPCQEKIKLYIFADVKTYMAYIQKEYPGAPMRRALFAMEKDKPGQIFTFLHEEFDVDLRHECTHALLHSKIGRLPIWIDEGLAEYFEAPKGQRVYKEPYFTQIKRNVSYNIFAPVPDLKKLESIKKMGDFLEVHYRNSWSWMNFMINDPSRQKLLGNYLALCKNADGTEKEQGAFPSFTDFLAQMAPKYKTDYKTYWKELKKPTK
ncbi:MAG: hypothetical protein IJQ39_08040 [Thermoguttaceae bacterium]|nr:hypothetical protein [Thermoguttaceae bacterium]